jgi:predicted RNA-binding protein with PIN domain
VQLGDELLRPALEFAVFVAAESQRARPPLRYPSGLKPYLRFQKLPTPALAVVRRVLDADDSYRSLLATAAGEDDLGTLSYLWLSRPPGWEDEAERLVTEHLAARERLAADREERSAERRADAAEASATRTRAELTVVRAELAGERTKRQAAEARANELQGRVAALDTQLESLRAALRVAECDSAAARRNLDEARAALATLRTSHEALSARLDETLAERAHLLSAAPSATTGADQAALAAAAAGLRELAGALAQLGAGLVDTANALVAPRSGSSAPRTGRAARRASGRTPLSVPGGLVGNQPEVVAHYLRAPGAVVVIDGYNVAKTAWPDLELVEQRERLLDALDDVVRRTGARLHVVFDGADVIVPATPRRLVNVRFSPAGVSADDVIRQLVAELPDDVPVVVVTSDNAVVADVRAMGANTLGSAQFLSGIGR